MTAPAPLPLTPARIAAIRARLQAATAGPWKLCPMELYIFGDGGHMIAWNEDPEDGTAGMRGAGAERSGQRPAGSMDRNADLIAHAPTDIADLLAAAEALLKLERLHIAGWKVYPPDEALEWTIERDDGESPCVFEGPTLAEAIAAAPEPEDGP